MKITQNLGIFNIEMHVFFEVFVRKGYESRAVRCTICRHSARVLGAPSRGAGGRKTA